jgi:3-methylcrotonyl-CoA carboxylase beta subunit
MFRNQSVLSKMNVKQLALVFGHCTAGGAYIPALSDYSRDRARHRRGVPRRPAAGEGRYRRNRHCRPARWLRPAHPDQRHLRLPRLDRGRGHRHRPRNRGAVGTTPKWNLQRDAVEPPYYDPDELYGIIPDDIKRSFDMRE